MLIIGTFGFFFLVFFSFRSFFLFFFFAYLFFHVVWLVCVCVCVCVCMCIVAQLCLTLCGPIDYIACQAPLPMEIFRQEYWSGLLSPAYELKKTGDNIQP